MGSRTWAYWQSLLHIKPVPNLVVWLLWRISLISSSKCSCLSVNIFKNCLVAPWCKLGLSKTVLTCYTKKAILQTINYVVIIFIIICKQYLTINWFVFYRQLCAIPFYGTQPITAWNSFKNSSIPDWLSEPLVAVCLIFTVFYYFFCFYYFFSNPAHGCHKPTKAIVVVLSTAGKVSADYVKELNKLLYSIFESSLFQWHLQAVLTAWPWQLSPSETLPYWLHRVSKQAKLFLL